MRAAVEQARAAVPAMQVQSGSRLQQQMCLTLKYVTTGRTIESVLSCLCLLLFLRRPVLPLLYPS